IPMARVLLSSVVTCRVQAAGSKPELLSPTLPLVRTCVAAADLGKVLARWWWERVCLKMFSSVRRPGRSEACTPSCWGEFFNQDQDFQAAAPSTKKAAK